MLGTDRALAEAKLKAARFAVTDIPVLLLADTGTGKELFARAIHEKSGRKGQLVAVNCGSLSPHLIASELFGYAPFAFTGASRTGSEGSVGAADGGTLFLDEIAETPEILQVSLLRLLDEGVYQRVGETRQRRSRFRLICATCKDLPALVAEGKFRKDLFYRLQGATVSLPALRDRSDLLFLAKELLAALAPDRQVDLGEDARAWVLAHDWPGNVRELKSAMAHALALSAGSDTIGVEHLPELLLRSSSPSTRAEILEQAISGTLRACAGNVSEAARHLGVGRGTIYRALKNRRS